MRKILFFFTLLFYNIVSAQSNEYIHLHFDKDIYLPGETIWFKAYLYTNNAASRLSTNFYVSMYDSDGKLLEFKQYPIFEGSTFGDFKIADTIKTISVRVRAFTQASTLYDSNYVFEKRLSIYNKNVQIQNSPLTQNDSIQLHFFAEGGKFVAGISNYLSFRATHKNGQAAKASGVILDEIGNIITDTFNTNTLGLGVLQITPKEAVRYYAKWISKNEGTSLTALPEVAKAGVVLHTEMIQNTLHYVVNKNKSTDCFKKMHLLAQMGDEEMYKADLSFGEGMQIVSQFSIDSMPTGILQITLFDQDWSLLSQRIVYINPLNITELNLKDLVKDSTQKAKNTIEIDLGNAKFTNLSASIADIYFYDTSVYYNIKKNLQYSSIKGLSTKMHEELDKNNPVISNQITLTHDWIKMKWQNLIQNKKINDKKVDNYLSLSIDFGDKKKKLNAEILNLLIDDKITGKSFYNKSLNENSHYSESGFIIYDSARINVGLKKSNEKSQFLNISVHGLGNFAKSIAPEKDNFRSAYISQNEKQENYIDSFIYDQPRIFNSEQTIKEVVVKTRYKNPATKRIVELDEKYTTGMFSGIARGYQLNLIDDENAWSHSDVLNYLLYRLPSLKICRSFGERFLIITRDNGPCDIKNALLTFIDEVELPNQVGLSSLPISQIAYIKFIPGIVAGSSFVSSNGALYIYTKKGDEPPPVTQKMKSTIVSGYNLPNYFSNPDYSDKSKLSNVDRRTTIYWNPYLMVDDNSNKIKIEYYNNDLSKKLLLTIEGIDADGKLIHIQKIIEY